MFTFTILSCALLVVGVIGVIWSLAQIERLRADAKPAMPVLFLLSHTVFVVVLAAGFWLSIPSNNTHIIARAAASVMIGRALWTILQRLRPQQSEPAAL